MKEVAVTLRTGEVHIKLSCPAEIKAASGVFIAEVTEGFAPVEQGRRYTSLLICSTDMLKRPAHASEEGASGPLCGVNGGRFRRRRYTAGGRPSAFAVEAGELTCRRAHQASTSGATSPMA